jgi:hypothetical protein
MWPSVAFWMVPRGADVDFRQFWMEKWTEVSFPSFPIPQVPSMIKIEIHKAKNKVCKSRGTILYLTLL